MNKVSQSRNFKIAVTGVFGALNIVLSFTPLGYLSVGAFIQITLLHIPVILATLLAGLVSGIATGLVFGLSSLIRSAMFGAVNPFFLNPIVSVLPRMLFPLSVWAVFRLLNLIPKMPRVISCSVAAAVGTFCHTALVMGTLYVFYGELLMAGMRSTFENFGYSSETLSGFGGFAAIMICTLATNGIWEIAAAVILTAAVTGSIYASEGKKSKLSRLDKRT